MTAVELRPNWWQRRLAALHREPILIQGKRIKFEFAQSLAWGLLLGLIIALIPAGVYFGVLEVHWYLPIGPEWLRHGFYLKHWWDSGMARWIVPGFFATNTWPLYRHGWRDLMEPAVATFGVKTAMAKRWERKDTRLGPVHLAVRVLAVFVLSTALVLAGIWLLDFGAPNAWHALGLPLINLGPLGKFSIGQLALGIVVGLVVHSVWAPAGSTLQGTIVDRVVGTIRVRRERRDTPDWLPVWVRRNWSPPPLRKRIAYELATAPDPDERPPSRALLVVAWTVIVLGVLFGVLGLIGHYLVGVFGMSIPYLAP